MTSKFAELKKCFRRKEKSLLFRHEAHFQINRSTVQRCGRARCAARSGPEKVAHRGRSLACKHTVTSTSDLCTEVSERTCKNSLIKFTISKRIHWFYLLWSSVSGTFHPLKFNGPRWQENSEKLAEVTIYSRRVELLTVLYSTKVLTSSRVRM